MSIFRGRLRFEEPATATVEVSELARNGTPGSFYSLDSDLSSTLTLAGGARIGDFLYIAGGNDGTGPTNAIYRSRILDRADGPVLANGYELSISGEGGEGRPARTWLYAVSAVFPGSYTLNPSGESVPGNLPAVHVPGVEGASVELSWASVPDETGYRLYRTTAAGAGPELLAVLAEVGAVTSYIDDGAISLSGSAPLENGCLGEWCSVASLNTYGNLRP